NAVGRETPSSSRNIPSRVCNGAYHWAITSRSNDHRFNRSLGISPRGEGALIRGCLSDANVQDQLPGRIVRHIATERCAAGPVNCILLSRFENLRSRVLADRPTADERHRSPAAAAAETMNSEKP